MHNRLCQRECSVEGGTYQGVMTQGGDKKPNSPHRFILLLVRLEVDPVFLRFWPISKFQPEATWCRLKLVLVSQAHRHPARSWRSGPCPPARNRRGRGQRRIIRVEIDDLRDFAQVNRCDLFLRHFVDRDQVTSDQFENPAFRAGLGLALVEEGREGTIRRTLQSPPLCVRIPSWYSHSHQA